MSNFQDHTTQVVKFFKIVFRICFGPRCSVLGCKDLQQPALLLVSSTSPQQNTARHHRITLLCQSHQFRWVVDLDNFGCAHPHPWTMCFSFFSRVILCFHWLSSWQVQIQACGACRLPSMLSAMDLCPWNFWKSWVNFRPGRSKGLGLKGWSNFRFGKFQKKLGLIEIYWNQTFIYLDDAVDAVMEPWCASMLPWSWWYAGVLCCVGPWKATMFEQIATRLCTDR